MDNEQQSHNTTPVPVERIIERPAVAARVRQMIGEIPAGNEDGGLCVRVTRTGLRALLYWGSIAKGTDALFREYLSPYGYDVSIVRNPAQFEKYGTLRG